MNPPSLGSTVFEKIRKLHTLASHHTSNPNEAAAAAAKVQALLFEHNLTMADVTVHAAGHEYEDFSGEFTVRARSWAINWHRDLLHVVARHNFCRAVHVKARQEFSIVGRRENVEVVWGWT